MAFDWLSNNSGALLQASAGLLGGRTGSEQAAMGFQGFGNAMTANKEKNKTLAFLRQMNPELAAAVEAGALSPLDAYKTHVEAQRPKKPNLMSAGGSLYNADTGEWMSPPAGAGNDAEYGLNPQYGVDAQGNPVILQLSKGGTSKQTALPDGVSLAKEPIKLDAGTHFVLLDPITRQPVGQIPKDLAGAETEKEVGAARGRNLAAAPGDLQAGENAKALIQDLRSDPNRERGTGFSSLANAIPGTAGYDYQNKVEQAKSGAFLTAIQQMRGLGALSNTEGAAATAAVTRMDTATSEEAFQAALTDYEKIIDQGIARAQSRLGGVTAPATPAGNARQTKTGVPWSIEP